MSPLVCMRCGAALGVQPEPGADAVGADRPAPGKLAGELRCGACGAVHAYEAAPTSTASSPGPLDPREPVIAEWGGLWWRAELIEPVGDAPERWRVRYVGWPDALAQELGRDRVQVYGGGAPVKRWKLVLAAVGVALLGATGILLANKGKLVKTQATPVEASTALTVGQAVEIEREGTWVAGEVLEVRDDGTVLVRYLDRGPMGDEPVARGRLRLP